MLPVRLGSPDLLVLGLFHDGAGMRPPLSKVVLLVLVFLVEGGPLCADGPASTDWPHLRGPTYDAISAETGLLDAWPEKGPPVLWTRELGQGYSGFVAVGGRVYTQFQSTAGQYVLSLDTDTGTEVWRQRVDWAWQPAGAYPGPYATPTWHEGRLYFATPTGLVGCLDARAGHLLWSVDVRKKFHGKGTEFGYAATPLLEGGRVIVPVGGKGASVVALDATDGSISWTVGDDPASYCPAYPITFRGRRLVVAFLRNAIAVHDPVTGKRLWRQELSTEYDEHSAWPLYAEPHLLVASPFRVGAQLMRLDETATDHTVRTVWANRDLANDVASSVLVGAHVYGFDLHQLQASAHRASHGRFKCLDFATGKVRWETDRVGQATLLAADSKLILLNDTGTLILARINATAYEELARTRVLDFGICWTPPTLWHGRLFVRNQTRAVCVFLGRPETLASDQQSTTASDLPHGLRFDWSRLVPREPDYPHDAPTPGAVALWFGWCVVGVFGGAGLVSGGVTLAGPKRWAGVAFAVTAFLLGVAGTTLLGLWMDAFVLTWPASLYVAFRRTLAVILWAERQPMKRRSRWLSRVVTLLFLVLCYGYYSLCRAVGYLMAWGFLAGFLPAAPAALVATRGRSLWLRGLADAVGFTLYFWVSGLLPGWKGSWFR